MGKGIIVVTPDYLTDVLHLPDGTEINLVYQKNDDPSRQIRIAVTHPDLPLVAEGGVSPDVRPTYFRDADGTVTMTHWGDAWPIELAREYIEVRIQQLSEIFKTE